MHAEGDVVDAEDKVYRGKCFCGAVTFAAEGLSDIWYCHCRQCRRLTGHYMAAAGVAREGLHIDGDVSWTKVSQNAAHGFCANCHSPLFWTHSERETISVVAGNLNGTRDLAVKGHVFVAEKGDYYEISDGLPQYDHYPEGMLRGSHDQKI